jgi:arylformamidase
MIYDISLPLDQTLAFWPGDESYRFALSSSIATGAFVNVGNMHASAHFGTHIDAPFHIDDTGATIDLLNLEAFWGIASVVDATNRSELTVDLFNDVDLGMITRLLIKTNAWRDHTVFPTTFPVLAEGVALYLAEHRITLFGIDVPSVDSFHAAVLSNHKILIDNNIGIIESLVLNHVPAGNYELVALPLRIVGGDGSPVRAALRDLGD